MGVWECGSMGVWVWGTAIRTPTHPHTHTSPSPRLTAGVAGFQVVPEAHALLGELPAEQHFSPVAQRREVDEAPVDVLHDDAAPREPAELRAEVREIGHVVRHLVTAAVGRRRADHGL